jgi:hypothetical protein
MKIVTKIVLISVLLYLIIGAFFAIRWSVTYDPHKTSFPNDATSFIINMLMWPV